MERAAPASPSPSLEPPDQDPGVRIAGHLLRLDLHPAIFWRPLLSVTSPRRPDFRSMSRCQMPEGHPHRVEHRQGRSVMRETELSSAWPRLFPGPLRTGRVSPNLPPGAILRKNTSERSAPQPILHMEPHVRRTLRNCAGKQGVRSGHR